MEVYASSSRSTNSRAAILTRSGSSGRCCSTSRAASSVPLPSWAPPLPQVEETLLSGDTATFLQRCSRHDIDRLDVEATRLAIAGPITEHGGSIDPSALDKAIAATSGYAFMVQLVGFHSWKAADTPEHITVRDVEVGIAEARRRVGRLVIAPVWRELSNVDRRFLLAMASDEGDSKLADIAARLGVGVNYAGVYRRRLINAGMIISTGKGRITLAHHAARGWLRDQATRQSI